MIRKSSWLWLLFSSFWLSAQAVTDVMLYQSRVPVASYAPEDWEKALPSALQQVLVKISQNPNITQLPAVRKAMAKPSILVQTFTYADEADNSGKKTLMLQVQFSPKAIDGLLQAANVAPTPMAPTTSSLAAPATGITAASVGVAPSSASAMENVNAATHSINMVVAGIQGLQDYAALLEYVRHVPGVVDVDSKQTQGDRVLLIVKMSSTMAELAAAIEKETKLAKEPIATDPAALVLSYRWVGANALQLTGAIGQSVQSVQPTTEVVPASVR